MRRHHCPHFATGKGGRKREDTNRSSSVHPSSSGSTSEEASRKHGSISNPTSVADLETGYGP